VRRDRYSTCNHFGMKTQFTSRSLQWHYHWNPTWQFMLSWKLAWFSYTSVWYIQ
jgi:hypothetical protein